MNYAVLIPVYNGADHIGELLESIKGIHHEVIVIDDGSKDDTAAIAERTGARVIRHKENKGKGAAIKTGIGYILKKDYEFIIMMDGDGQHSAPEIHEFIRKYRLDKTPLIIGNRMHDVANMPRLRYLTNRTMSRIISELCRQYIPDSQCGFRLVAREVLEKIKLTCNNYEIESEMLIRAAREGFKIESIPVKSIYEKEISYINPLRDTGRFIKIIFQIYFKKNG